jgi:hypothetical protein
MILLQRPQILCRFELPNYFLHFFVAPRVEEEYDEDGVRAPIPQKQETLIQPGKFFRDFSTFDFFFKTLF